jgi:superoxide dismutase
LIKKYLEKLPQQNLSKQNHNSDSTVTEENMKYDKILEQVTKMIDVSNKRMDLIMKGTNNHDYERWELEAAQREAEIQIKLLEKIIKNLNGDKEAIDVTPKD